MAKGILSFLLFIVFTLPAWGGLKIYYIRHGEQGGNVVKQWSGTPKELWPDYVGKSNVFTPLGEEQVAYVPEKLSQYSFDHIIASPTWRTLHTILPYLKANDRKAEIWTELMEISYIRNEVSLNMLNRTDLPEPASNLMEGKNVKIPLNDEERAYFIIPESDLPRPYLVRKQLEAAADLVQLNRGILERIKKEYGEGDLSVLLVGHGSAGRALFRVLTEGKVKSPAIKNTGVWMVEEQEDGSFLVKIYNDAPVED